MSSGSTNAFGLAGRYASALFGLAEADNLLDVVADDLSSLAAMIGHSDELRRLISSPVFSRPEQMAAMDALMDKAEMNPLTKRFTGVITANRRLSDLVEIISAFQSRLAAHRGETTAEVISAKPLTDNQLAAVGDAIKQAVGTNVTVNSKVNADLLGGLIVKVGSLMVDSSLRTKLQQLRLSMKGAG